MKKQEIKEAISRLEDLLKDFREAKAKGKETNSNEVRARSITDIEEITQRLEAYMRHNEELLQLINGKEITLTREIEWNDVVRPSHFEEDLETEIAKLKKMNS